MGKIEARLKQMGYELPPPFVFPRNNRTGCTQTGSLLLLSGHGLDLPKLPGVRQTGHTHPSERIGVIMAGRGRCRTPEATFDLQPGMGWRIPTGCLHAFSTESESLDVVAWHPDSDFGPTDEDHPMINRTDIHAG